MIQSDASAGVRIKVREEDFEKALDVYRRFLLDEGELTEKESEKNG